MFNHYSFRRRSLMLMVVGLLSPALLQAQQMIAVQEGVEVRASLSSKALNRIAVHNDRILSVKGTQGEFELDKDSDLGQVFIKPLPNDSEEPIHLFLSTESGKSYALALMVEDIGAQSLVLTPSFSNPASWEQAGSYEGLIKTLMKAMHTQIAVEGFAVEASNLKLHSIQGAKLLRLQTYTGHPLQGEVLELHNSSAESLNFDEMDFYVEGVRAITLIDKVLKPHGKTRVYRVRS